MTRAQKQALRILGIQETKRGWVKQGLLLHIGIARVTLVRLQRQGMTEFKSAPRTYFGDYASLWRLTGAGETKLASLTR